MEPVYTTVIGICLGSFSVMDWDITVTGAEHLPATGGGVVATNHVGYLDFIFVGAGVREQSRRRLRFLAKREIWNKAPVAWLMNQMKHIPVDRGGKAVESLHAAEDALRDGELIGMFPEATISRSFVPLPGKTGAARMAMDTGTPLIPGAVWGTQRLWTKGRPRDFRRHVPVTVSFGAPIEYDPDEDPVDVTTRMMDAIGGLADRAQRTYPDVPATPDDDWWLPAHLGGSAPTPAEAERLAKEEADRRRARRAQELG